MNEVQPSTTESTQNKKERENGPSAQSISLNRSNTFFREVALKTCLKQTVYNWWCFGEKK